MRKISILAKSIRQFFCLSKLKVVFLRLCLPSLLFQKQNFLYRGRKHVQIQPIRSHELTIPLKYYMPFNFS